ncbi:MAG: ATP-dependent metallopeptidase FtsH/Yme1/Tma family protein [Deltaproteobacteria bacterium]|nr:ATP-dependent metallopeptidase FtsH/Yme1/Tma family protein [Deltaproteobacteria bacterium]MBI2229120.1 ATP-dependent metallopeptidase FtsH/Yme1/Tma family protein [Deltaproteobacteria bacterium]MBI2532759.1 ATP-dependent metallopeptidase FtsH/Yme1/Tma family protein [Deltaproteobacteria bacterium]MBI3066003.1 ATP-dependent metallopeptidase FtsH/Yme1/Tma family protein [Deltaproteobacteria bacterium]
MTQSSKHIALWLVLALVFLVIFSIFSKQHGRDPEIVFSEFMSSVDRGDVQEVVIQGHNIQGKYKNGERFRTFAPNDPELVKSLREKRVKIAAKPEEDSPWYMVLLLNWFPMLLLIGVWIFFMRQMQVGGGKAMSFGKSRAKLLTENQHRVTFSDVAGVDEAKDDLQEIIAFLKDPKKFTKLGGRIPKGCLLVGPPGTGKTLLARAVAGEAGVPFFSISGSDFVEMFVGVGASRVRDLFVQGKKNAPCIIFIDEIDAVGRHRGAGLGGGHDEREQTLNQLLVEMDGFEANEGVILIAATNRPDVLDPALLRPGRFDRRVVVPRPDIKGREGILQVHTRKVPLAQGVDVVVLARATPGFAGADLENLVNEAALLAARNNKDKVEMQDFELAKDKVMMGAERRSMIISDEEKRNTAYHEAGHALVAKLLPGADPIHKVTIIPRGMALGLTQQLPMDEKHTYPRGYLLNNLVILFGGRVAEELVLEHMTTGAGNDIEKATELARRMVCEWGMSEKLGPMTFGKKEEEIFLGRDFTQKVDYSENTAIEIDAEVRRIIQESYHRAKDLLKANLGLLHKVAGTLLEKEVLDGSEIDAIVREFGGNGGNGGDPLTPSVAAAIA